MGFVSWHWDLWCDSYGSSQGEVYRPCFVVFGPKS